jgi:hypothetical protein
MKAHFIDKFNEYISLLPQELKEVFEQLKNTPQREDYHPEGSSYEHIKLVFNEALKTNDINLIIAALFHDLGKASTTKIGPKGFPISYGHEFVSAKYVQKYDYWIKNMGGDPELIYYIVSNHMRLHMFSQMRKTKQQIMMSHPDFEMLKQFGILDHKGRG